ncbi:MFS transporter [Psychrobacter lutiphocae]|uniref:MFS transporter n=1 Tax=Psychrobacter lutiphocae TaxID=540500 RepID=UPI000376DD52|nr:MFS transporter [Psychrobacter lutiphocae]
MTKAAFPNNNTGNRSESYLSKINFNYQIIFVCLSYALAAFDFLIYLHIADVISSVFFPSSDNALVTQLKIIGLMSVGFLSRPLGAILIGRYGDIKGRKPAFLISIGLLSATTLLTAFLPTYAQVGIIAPILFVFIRMLQGIAFGAHAPLSWVFVAEHTKQTKLATYCSLAVAGGIFGSVISVIFAKVLVGTFELQALLDYGWRIPAVMGGVMSGLILLMWHHVRETPVYVNHQKKLQDNPDLLTVNSFSNIASATFLSCAISFVRASLIMVVMILLPKLIALKFYTQPNFATFASLFALVTQIVGCIFYGILADKIGTAKTFMLASLALTLQVWIFYAYLINGEGVFTLAMYGLVGFCTGMIGLCTAIFVQLFPTNIRLLSVSVTYNCISALLGAALPFLLFKLTDYVSFAPAIYLSIIGITALIIGWHLVHRETFGELYKSNTKEKRYTL